jgi:hypothetical protein
MKKLFAASVLCVITAIATPGIARATNVKQLPLSSGSQPVTIATTDNKGHLLDFSNSDRTVTGVWVDDPQEFARSFKVEPVNGDPKMLSFTGVKGGSSKFTANLITVDSSGNQYIQPMGLVKRASEENITRFVERPDEVASVLNNGIDSTVTPATNNTPTNINPQAPATATPVTNTPTNLNPQAPATATPVTNTPANPNPQAPTTTVTPKINTTLSTPNLQAPTTVTPATNTTPTTLNLQSSTTTVTPVTNTTPVTPERAAKDLRQGAIAAVKMSALVDPELQSRVIELVTATNSGQDPYQAAQSIGISQQYVTKLMDLGRINPASAKSASNSLEQN